MPIKKPTKLKQLIINLNKSDPWTNKERKTFVPYERSFIRIFQLKNKESKQKAIGRYMDYLHKSKEQTRKIRRGIDEFKSSLYPKHGKVIERAKISRHIRPSPHKKTSQKTSQKFSNRYSSYEEWLRNQSTIRINHRVIKAHQKYPDDNLYQLQHGHYAGGGK